MTDATLHGFVYYSSHHPVITQNCNTKDSLSAEVSPTTAVHADQDTAELFLSHQKLLTEDRGAHLMDSSQWNSNDVSHFGFDSHQGDDMQMEEWHQTRGTDLDSRLSNAMLTYDSLATPLEQIPMPLDSSNAYAYDMSASYTPSSTGIDAILDQVPISQDTPVESRQLSLSQAPVFASLNAQTLMQASLPLSRTSLNGVRGNSTGRVSKSSSASNGPLESPAASRLPSHWNIIQPKKLAPMNELNEGTALQAKPASYSETPPFPNIYSSSGFDVAGIISRVASRPNPKINIGAVDLSCAFALCDLTKEDLPIVYVSDAFERLTGYTKEEIVGRNCRFLQGPDGKVQQGAKRNFVDEQTAFRLKSTIDERSEIQVSLINYRKGGQPFMNLITMIPIRWNSADYRFYVGFQVDLVERPDAITKKNPNGTFMINYQRNQLPPYVPPPDAERFSTDLTKRFGDEEVSAILNAIGYSGSPFSKQYLERMLVENTDDVIHVLSFDCEFLYLSPSCNQVLEFDPCELQGKTLSSICHPSDIGPVIRDFRANTTASMVSVVYRIRKKYSGYMWFECHGSWHIELDRGRQYLVLAGRERPVYCFDRIAELESDGIGENDLWAKTSLSGMLLFVSSKARPVLGRQSDELIGKSVQELIGTDSKPEILQALEMCRSGRQATFSHHIRHKKGHVLNAQTTFYPGDTKEGNKPTFLIAQIRPIKASPTVSNVQLPPPEDQQFFLGAGSTLVPGDMAKDQGVMALAPASQSFDLNTGLVLPSGTNQCVYSPKESNAFAELKPTRGSSWQFELRELEKQNQLLYDELQALLNRKKKRKRKKTTVPVEKACAMCYKQNTPEWRRGPSGNRDLCNSCGLRWAKQVRNAARASDDKERSASSSAG